VNSFKEGKKMELTSSQTDSPVSTVPKKQKADLTCEKAHTPAKTQDKKNSFL